MDIKLCNPCETRPSTPSQMNNQKAQGNQFNILSPTGTKKETNNEKKTRLNRENSSYRKQPPRPIKAPISLGELVDKITILEIKSKNFEGSAWQNVNNELTSLNNTLQELNIKIDVDLIAQLKKVNEKLWEIEDNIRVEEKNQTFGDKFIELARSVYLQNDERASIKRKINTTYNSELIEEKSYEIYGNE